MSVQTSTSRVQYQGNGSTVTAYPVPFTFALASDLVAIISDSAGVETALMQGTDYSVTGAGNPNGGNVVTAAAWDNTHKLTIYRNVDATQLTSYADNDAFPASSHERALDKLTYLVQQLLRGVTRCFSVSEASTPPGAAPNVPLAVVGTDASGAIVLRTVSELISFLSLGGAITNFPGATWANDGERAAKVPDYIGQIGLQRDSGAAYKANALAAGSWAAVNLATGTLTNAMIAANAAIAFSKLASLTSGQIIVGNGSNVATAVAMSQDATLANDGKLTIAANAVTTSKIADANVTGVKLATGAAAANLAAGSILQVQNAEVLTYLTTSTVIPKDDTIPQSTEGSALISCSITPASTANKVLVRLVVPIVAAATVETTFAIFRGAATGAIAAGTAYATNTDPGGGFVLEFVDSPASAAAVTYNVRFGPASGTAYVNGSSGNRLFGGTSRTVLTLQEIKG